MMGDVVGMRRLESVVNELLRLSRCGVMSKLEGAGSEGGATGIGREGASVNTWEEGLDKLQGSIYSESKTYQNQRSILGDLEKCL
jgi:hypothetical protein